MDGLLTGADWCDRVQGNQQERFCWCITVLWEIIMSDDESLSRDRRVILDLASTLFGLTEGEHELFQVITPTFHQDYRRFLEYFGPPGLVPESPMAYAHKKCVQILQEACEDPEKKIVVTHDVPSIIRGTNSFSCDEPPLMQ